MQETKVILILEGSHMIHILPLTCFEYFSRKHHICPSFLLIALTLCCLTVVSTRIAKSGFMLLIRELSSLHLPGLFSPLTIHERIMLLCQWSLKDHSKSLVIQIHFDQELHQQSLGFPHLSHSCLFLSNSSSPHSRRCPLVQPIY